jgi:phage gp45-like
MFRQTPLTSAFVGYTSGGARTLIDTIDDGKMMQEMKGTMMFGEARDRVESPQNYGFSSVVRPATKGKDGQIQSCAEGFMSFMGGNRSFPVCSIMDDRRYRPYGMKPGENAQYDDLGQMTILRRTGLYLLSLDGPDDSQQESSGGAAPGQHDGSSGGGQTVQRFVSIRHVEKQKQQRKNGSSGQSQNGSSGNSGSSPSTRDDSSGSASTSQSQQDFQHEGQSVNHEIKVSKANIQTLDSTTVVSQYTKQTSQWNFIGKEHLVSSSDKHTVTTKQVNINGSTSATFAGQQVNINGTTGIALSGPTSVNGNPVATADMLAARDAAIAALEARVASLEARATP